MKWPWSGNTTSQEVEQSSPINTSQEPIKTNYTPGQKILLKDTDPRFQDNTTNKTQTTDTSSTLKQAWGTVSKEEFTLANLVNIPCFRDAGILGFSAMFLMGLSTAIITKKRKPLMGVSYWNKIINWSIGGLLFGSVVGWEQCRLQRRKSFEIAQLAIETVQRKEKPMLKHKDNSKTPQTQELLKEWGEHPNDVTKDNNNNKSNKSW
ncbi:cytochrome c oxidase assembly protein Cox20p, mitochondrial [Monosporozyma unispora]|nr:Cytochrome c oxidase assembly protein cox20, mitochondrial [Kazachstania unispora]